MTTAGTFAQWTAVTPEDAVIAAVRALGAATDAAVAPAAAALRRALEALAPQPLSALDAWRAANASPHARALPLMDPVRALLAVLVYFAVLAVGVRAMRDRPKFSLAAYSWWHNLVLTALSFYTAARCVYLCYRDGINLLGFLNNVDHSPSGFDMAKISWLFYFAKYPELIDTVIMMLKKNNRQISFLHVYHHSTIVLYTWLVVFWAPGGEFALSVILNSTVHVVMYGYYLLSSMGFKKVAVIKYYITAMQMTQFAILLTQALTDAITETMYPGTTNFPAGIAIVNIFYMISMLVLFGNFYVQDKKRIAKERAAQKLKSQ